jgi:hypothetical protein
LQAQRQSLQARATLGQAKDLPPYRAPEPGAYASIPDATLSASNARVLAASRSGR